MSEIKQVKIPDIGGATDVDVIEILVASGDQVAIEGSLITLEGDKATMEVPSPFAGTVEQIQVKLGDKVSEGSDILTLKVEEGGALPEKGGLEVAPGAVEGGALKKEPSAEAPAPRPAEPTPARAAPAAPSVPPSYAHVHAGPAVRRIAREFGVDLSKVKGSGPKGRILKTDVQQYVKGALARGQAGIGLAIEPAPAVDFSRFGEIEPQPLTKIQKLSGANLYRNWITIPHITQFGEADITDLEQFRQCRKPEVEKQGFKLTPLVFIMKAVVGALKEFPRFNASLDPSGETLILKKYFHLGVAVDTPTGLMVPVIRDVNTKSISELARELSTISKKAREEGLSMKEMQGGCFTISSLGGIGGTAFTPIINAPEVAILGVSRTYMKPIYDKNKGTFEPKLMLPLSLSYDHRVIDGAAGARFMVYLMQCLEDVETLLM